ncbi:MAG: NTPase [Hyphomicrobiales bacterium]
MRDATKLLITGPPGTGKTTLFKKLAAELGSWRPVGFYTEEIRAGGVRKGFGLRSLDGRAGVLAHVDFAGRSRVGKYGVDVAGFDGFLAEIAFPNPEAGLVMVDEIGKMECLSRRFQQVIRGILDSERLLIATIAQHGGGLIEEIKRRRDVRIYALTAQNRDAMVQTLLAEVQLPNLELRTLSPNP